MQYNITYRQKDNSIQYIISYKNHNGKWRQKARQGFKTFQEAEAASLEGVESLKNNGEIPKPKFLLRRKYNVTFRIKNGGYQYIISYKNSDGKWRQKTKQGFTSLEEAKKASLERLEYFKQCNFISGVIDGVEKYKTNNKTPNRKKYNDLKGEIWREVVGYEGLYKVSNKGRVMSVRMKNVFSLCSLFSGYVTVSLTKDGKACSKTVHRLVAEAFIPNPENKPFVDHINTKRKDNRLENLRWATPEENMNNEITKKNIKRTKDKNRNRKIKKLSKLKF